jgi:hypothetical protein
MARLSTGHVLDQAENYENSRKLSGYTSRDGQWAEPRQKSSDITLPVVTRRPMMFYDALTFKQWNLELEKTGSYNLEAVQEYVSGV